MHAAPGSNWKLVVLILVIILVVAGLGFLAYTYFTGGFGGGAPERALTPAASDLPLQVAAYDSRGRAVSDSVAVTTGTLRPEVADADADLILADIAWVGKKDAHFPLILSVSDSSFTNNDGLSVYHYVNDQWQFLGTYLIEDNSVAFEVSSLSPFAFQVISSKPEPTATPEPTPTPVPTPTPEPTPVPIDYGQYDRVQVGEFPQANAITKGGVYLIAFVDDPNAEEAVTTDGDVTFFNIVEDQGPFPAAFLVNYDGKALSLVEGEVTKGADGRYTITSTIVEGMLWTAVTSDPYYGLERFSLVNNNKYLNLDDANENIVLDDNSGRTRWLYGAVVPASGASFTTMSYQIGEDTYFVQEMALVSAVTGEGTDAGKTLRFTASKESDTAKKLVIFQLANAQTGAAENGNGDSNTLSGLYILTGTPSAVEGLDATPAPTEAPVTDNNLIPVSNDNSGTSNNGNSNSNANSNAGTTNTDNSTTPTDPPPATNPPVNETPVDNPPAEETPANETPVEDPTANQGEDTPAVPASGTDAAAPDEAQAPSIADDAGSDTGSDAGADIPDEDGSPTDA